jgi:hypothetical protein
MGCDIHCYVEHRALVQKSEYDRYWSGFGGRINPGRNYRIFGRLAGVRRDGEEQVAPVRGIPNDLAYDAAGDFWMWIVYEGEAHDGAVTVEKATKYHASYGAAYRHSTNAQDSSRPQWVQDPDAHTASWVTPDEWSLALVEDANEHEYHAMLAAMRELERRGREVRVVFWFDN